ncbi:MAG: hypothetical protein M1819_004283 [Sarea resinae]|nr:MAG: hypothetical protein M1819_004283 [Sarea resinae]
MNDPGLNQLLKWGVENSTTSQSDQTSAPSTANRNLNPDALAALFGGPSDADLMRESMAVITSPDPAATLDNKLIAFDNFEQLLESVDNANNLEPLGLWTPLVGQLESPEADCRRFAAWCVGTAVQNNVKAQERLLALNAIPTLATLALTDPVETVRRKAVYALSSATRNYQPALDSAVTHLPTDIVGEAKADAGDMENVDGIMQRLRDRSAKRETEGVENLY